MADSYPEKIPAKVVIEHKGVFCSNGKLTTAAANEEHQFQTDDGDNITTGNSVAVTAIGNELNFTVNDQTRKIYIPANQTVVLDAVKVNKITIVESGVSFSYVGGYYR